ncbi:MAG TPA: hypothetical protein VGR67_11130 [Candidatus Polarisedimenticolia bacterium]|jgi:hypothetical protein|nr:hypothetical protein [Candidatus Polarisedimenticolia bacterium]
MIRRGEKILLWLSTVLTAGSGALYAWMKYLMKPEDPLSVVNHPWQPGLLAAHVLAAPLLLFGIGLITREHILGRFHDPRARKRRLSGTMVALAAAPMVASGYLLQVLTAAPARRTAGLIHLALGAAFVTAYSLHAALGRRAEKVSTPKPAGSLPGPSRTRRRRVSAGPN